MPPQNKGITHEASMDVELYTQAIFELNFFLSMTTNVYFFLNHYFEAPSALK